MNPWIGVVGVIIGVLITGLLQRWSDERRWKREDELRLEQYRREEQLRHLTSKADAYTELVSLSISLRKSFRAHSTNPSQYEAQHKLLDEELSNAANVMIRAKIYCPDSMISPLERFYSAMMILDDISRQYGDHLIPFDELRPVFDDIDEERSKFTQAAKYDLGVKSIQ